MLRVGVCAALVVFLGWELGAGDAQQRTAAIGGRPLTRLALVVGNNDYSSEPLGNAVNDAQDVAAALKKWKFQVTPVVNANLSTMRSALATFKKKVSADSVALVFYAGHGIQINRENYLLPVDVNLTNLAAARRTSVTASEAYAAIADAALPVLVLDACRDRPFSAPGIVSRGLAPMTPGRRGSIIAFSTAENEPAADAGGGRNSVFTRSFLRWMSHPGLDIDVLFKNIRLDVLEATGQRQRPSLVSESEFKFSFNESAPVREAEIDAAETESWEAAVRSNWSVPLLNAYLTKYPAGRYAARAVQLIKARDSAPITAADQRRSLAVSTLENRGPRDADWIGKELARRIEATMLETGQFRINSADRAFLHTPTADVTVTGTFLQATAGGPIEVQLEVTSQGAPAQSIKEVGTQAELFSSDSRLEREVTMRLGIALPEERRTPVTGPNSPDVAKLFQAALVRLQQYDSAGAVIDLRAVTLAEPKFAQGFLTLARAYSELGQAKLAREAAAKARELLGNAPPDVFLRVAVEHARVNDRWIDAIAAQHTLLQKSPEDTYLAVQLAELQIEGQKGQAALETLNGILKRDPGAATDPRVLLLEPRAQIVLGKYAEAIAPAIRAAVAAESAKLYQLAGRARVAQALSLQRTRRPEEAISANEQAQKMYETVGDRAGVAAALTQLGTCYTDLKDYARAIEFHSRALALSRALGHPRGMAAALNNLGNALSLSGQAPAARTSFDEALAILTESGDRPRTASALNNLANAAVRAGRLEEAVVFDTKALALKRQLENRAALFTSLANIAETSIDLLDLKSSDELYAEALAVAQQMNRNEDVAYALQGAAVSLMYSGRLTEALQYSERAEKVASAAEDVEVATAALLTAGAIHFWSGRCDAALGIAARVAERQPEAFAARVLRLQGLSCKGQHADVIREAESPQTYGDSRLAVPALGALAYAHAARRDRPAAEATVSRMKEHAAKTGSRMVTLLAEVFQVEMEHRLGAANPARLESVKKQALAAGTGLLTARLGRLR